MANSFFSIILTHSLLTLLLITPLFAQESNLKLNEEEISITIDSISHKLRINYVFPEVAEKMVSVLNANLEKGLYNPILDPKVFAKQLTDDLQSVSKDKHLMVIYNPSIIARENALTDEDRANEEAEWIITLKKNLERHNYGCRDRGNLNSPQRRDSPLGKSGSEIITSR